MADNLSTIDQHFNRMTQTLGEGSRAAAIAFNVATEDVNQMKAQVKAQVVEVIEKTDALVAEKNSQIRNLKKEVSELKTELHEKSKHVEGLRFIEKDLRLRFLKVQCKVERLEEEVETNKVAKELLDAHFWVCDDLYGQIQQRNAAKREREARGVAGEEEDEVKFEEDDGFLESDGMLEDEVGDEEDEGTDEDEWMLESDGMLEDDGMKKTKG